MRTLVLLALALLAPAASAQPAPTKPDPAMARLRAKLNPEFAPWSVAHVYERCAEHLATINQKDRCRIRYFDMSDVPRFLLPTGTSALLFGGPSAARATITRVPRAVPATDNRIFWIDLGWFGWTAEVWENISAEDPYFREPLIPSDSKALKFLKDETRGNPVVRGGWFLWYTYDNTEFLKAGEVFNEKSFYYQLIYASFGFEREVKEKVAVKKKVTTYRDEEYREPYGNGYIIRTRRVPVETETEDEKTETVKKKVFGIGPANAKEFRNAWHIDLNVVKDVPIDRGALVDEGFSGVSYSNRVLWRVRTATGVYWRTFDVFRTAGDQDFVEKPFPGKFDAGEHIFQDERGAQFYLLTNGQDVSTDIGDPRVVKDHVSGARVLMTAGSCIHCHDSGILPFRNEHYYIQKSGAALMAITPDRAERFDQFFLQERKMKKLVAQDQENYRDFIRDCNGLSSEENATQFGRFRQWYMKPVTLDQAAREHGVDSETLSRALAEGIGDLNYPQGSTKGRLGRLALEGTPIPRSVWERGAFQESGLLLLLWQRNARMKSP